MPIGDLIAFEHHQCDSLVSLHLARYKGEPDQARIDRFHWCGAAKAPGKVLVVGAGPTSLEAARVLDKRAYEVMLAEARLLDAKDVMSQPNEFPAERCDALLAQIAAARGIA